MNNSKTVSRETLEAPVSRPRRDCKYPSAPTLSGSCPVCLGTLPCPCVQAYGDPATLGGDLAAVDAEIDAIEAAALERVRDRDADVRVPQVPGETCGEWIDRLDAAREAASLVVHKDGALVAFEPFTSAHDPDPCAVCEGRGGDVEEDGDGMYRCSWCRTCGGTGERKWCGECLDALPRGGEPEQKHEATHELTVDAGARKVTRLVCEEPAHLGCALRDVVDMARRVRTQHEDARAADARLRAAIEADASREPL